MPYGKLVWLLAALLLGVGVGWLWMPEHEGGEKALEQRVVKLEAVLIDELNERDDATYMRCLPAEGGWACDWIVRPPN